MLLLAAAVGSLALVKGRDAAMASTRVLFGQINGRIADHIAGFLDAAKGVNDLNLASFQVGELDMARPAEIERHLVALMRAHPDISSSYVGSLAGGIVDAGREGAQGAEYVIETPLFVAGPFMKHAIDARGAKGAVLLRVPSFDARTRPWFRAAIDAGRPIWIEPFALFSGQDSAISTARPILDAQGRVVGVASVDIFLSQIGAFLGRINRELGGTSFLIDDAGRLVASTSDTRIFDLPRPGEQPERIRAYSSSDPLVASAALAIARDGGGRDSERFYSFRRGEERLVALVSRFPESGDLGWRIVTAFPEKAFMAPVVSAARSSILLIAVAAAILCLLTALAANVLATRLRQFSEFASAVATERGSYPAHGMKLSRVREVGSLQRDLVSMRADLEASFSRLEEEIEERRRAEAGLSESKRAYDGLARVIPVGIYLLREGGDGSFSYDYQSPRFRELLGFDPDGPILGPEAYAGKVRRADLESYLAAQEAALAAKGGFRWEGWFSVGDSQRCLRLESIPEAQEGGDTLWHGVLTDVTESREAEERIRRLLGERDLLLHEVHHRLKNNMNTAIAILTMQADSEGDSRVVGALNAASGRLRSMAHLYNVLYRSDQLDSVLVNEYLPLLVGEIHGNFPNSGSVEIQVEAGDFRLSPSKTIPLGMIVNELFTNSMKHAFAGRERGRISVSASLADGRVTLAVSDDGVGMPPLSPAAGSRGFGMTLVEGLVAQLEGELRHERDAGTRLVVSFAV